MAKQGRPSSFKQEIADEICERLADAESLRSICCDRHMPSQTTVFRWLADDDHKSFREQYARAREAQADAIFDECLDIADDATNDFMERKRADGTVEEVPDAEHIQRSRLRIDTRRWMAGKLAPKKYGDKTLIGSDPDNPLPAGFTVNLVKGDDAQEG